MPKHTKSKSKHCPTVTNSAIPNTKAKDILFQCFCHGSNIHIVVHFEESGPSMSEYIMMHQDAKANTCKEQ